MEYSTPELVVLGTAATLVLGMPPGIDDNGTSGEHVVEGVVAGLD
jgi:hypothetical protein